MLNPTPDQHALLKAVIDAGPDGLRLDGPELALKLGDLMGLALAELVDVSDNRRVIATARGRAFRLRDAAA